jgi:hypothetical protein
VAIGGSAFESIAHALEEPAGRATFARGLVLGAIAGAALAGSILRARAARRRRSAAADGTASATVGARAGPGGEPGAGSVPSTEKDAGAREDAGALTASPDRSGAARPAGRRSDGPETAAADTSDPGSAASEPG